MRVDDARDCEFGHVCLDYAPWAEQEALEGGEGVLSVAERTEGKEAEPSWPYLNESLNESGSEPLSLLVNESGSEPLPLRVVSDQALLMGDAGAVAFGVLSCLPSPLLERSDEAAGEFGRQSGASVVGAAGESFCHVCARACMADGRK